MNGSWNAQQRQKTNKTAKNKMSEPQLKKENDVIQDPKAVKIKRALLSVSDKEGLVDFAQKLADYGVEILSTGGTAKAIKEAGITVKDVSDHTGFPEIMDGRVKTLHPKVHGGILSRRSNDSHVQAQSDHDIGDIDLVVVNLYPFSQTVAANADYDTCIENIDIGGPAMLRAGAKNHDAVTVVVDSADYGRIVEAIENDGGTSYELRFQLAAKVYAHTGRYDGLIANYLGEKIAQSTDNPSKFGDTFSAQFDKVQDMRYGENPHQDAAFYREKTASEASVSTATQLQGKALSFNNIADTDAALECVKSFAEPACVIVKHANPCGVAISDDIMTAYDLAFQTDPTSAFGGIIAFNRPLDVATASAIIDRQFVEVIIAPEISAEAQAVLTQ